MLPRLTAEKAAEVSLRAAWWCLRAPVVFTRALARGIVVVNAPAAITVATATITVTRTRPME